MQPTIIFDFDGVIHSYTSGWKGADVIPDPPVEGIRDAIGEIRAAGYRVVVVSTRCYQTDGIEAIRKYLVDNDIEVDDVTGEKPPALLTIDDRCIRFTGDTESLLTRIIEFRNWQQKQKVYLMVGNIGSGKSHEAGKIAAENKNAVIISKDVIRLMLFGRYEYRVGYERLVYSISRDAISHALMAGRDVVIDETNLTRDYRAEIVGLLEPIAARLEVFVYDFGPDSRVDRMDKKGIDEETWNKVGLEFVRMYEKPELYEFPAGTTIYQMRGDSGWSQN